jgi:hypothetical protein
MCLQLGFVIFWQKDFGTKAAHKMLVKLTPGSLVVTFHFGANCQLPTARLNIIKYNIAVKDFGKR